MLRRSLYPELVLSRQDRSQYRAKFIHTIPQYPNLGDLEALAMCYTVLVVEKHCEKRHVLQATACWRHCADRAEQASKSNNWQTLCEDAVDEASDYYAWSPNATVVESHHCPTCLAIDGGVCKVLRLALEPLEEAKRNAEEAIRRNNESIERAKERRQRGEISQVEEEAEVTYHEQFLQGLALRTQQREEDIDKLRKQLEVAMDAHEGKHTFPIIDEAWRKFQIAVDYKLYAAPPGLQDMELLRPDCPKHFKFPDDAECDETEFPHRILEW